MANSENLEALMSYLDISNEEEEELILEIDVEEAINRFELCLVGRFLTEKTINIRAMSTKMADLWKPSMGAWENPVKVPLYELEFWIQIYDLPSGYMTEQVGKQLGDFLGSFILYDQSNNTSIWREYMRIKIKVDVRRPLKRKKKICRRDKSELIVQCSEGMGKLASSTTKEGAAQGRSKWLREEGDENWGEKVGRGYDNEFKNANFSQSGMRWDKARREIGNHAIIKGGLNLRGNAILAGEGISVLEKCSGSGELDGLDLDERKRKRTGLTVTRDTEETNKSQHHESILSMVDFNSRIEELRGRLGFTSSFAVDRVRRSGGLAVFWKANIDCSISSYSQNHIDITFNERSIAVWRLSCFYGYPERTRRRESWDLIRRLVGLSLLPWCILGDFNDMLYQADKRGKHQHSRSLMEGFRKAIEDSLLTEIELNGGLYTWEKSRGSDDWVQERIDRAFATSGWHSKFPLCKMNVVKASVSDHDPIVLELVHVMISKREFRFKFENTWLKEKSFINDVSSFWSEIPTMSLLPKLSSVSKYMEKWGRNFFNKFREKLRVQKGVLDDLKDRTDDRGVQQYLFERDKLNDLLLHEEIYWKQRAKLFWEDGTRVDTKEGMGRLVQDYFISVFGEAGAITETGLASSPRRVSDMQNVQLTSNVSFEEFSEAIHQMHPDKASGPDGLNPAFYQNFWKVMGKEVFESCKGWLRGEVFPADLNSTNVVLIPKKEGACRMKDLRPIALCNVPYKILAKVLSNRLKAILPDLITEKQSAFVPDRCIMDNVIMAFEVVHHMRRGEVGSEGEVALKLDISKAYDRVDWGYLKNHVAAEEGRVHGYRISANAPEITHLLFADDRFLFFKATTEEAMHVKQIMATYEELSGQSVNFQKSGVLFNSNVRRDKQAKEELKAGFRWILGNGVDIVATRDPWLRSKQDFCVEDDHMYVGREEKVANLFYAGTNSWDVGRVRGLFTAIDADAILATFVPQRLVGDRIARAKSNDGLYDVKTGYQYWQGRNNSSLGTVPQSGGWKRIWRLPLPHKMKVFLWRLCRNNIHVRNRLKGTKYKGLQFDTSTLESTPDWLLGKLDSAGTEEIVSICTILWGVWFWRNKKVWERRSVNASVAMDGSFNTIREWREAREVGKRESDIAKSANCSKVKRWLRPEEGTFKCNVDASFYPGADTFSVGMVIRDCRGSFLEGKCMTLKSPASVFEAECIGVREALSWVQSRDDRCEVVLETDSLLTVDAIKGTKEYRLEVDHVVDQCNVMPEQSYNVKISHIRKHANRVAHGLARIPCTVNCFNVFSSPPDHLVETVLSDNSIQ
ncbi:hypothetical protein AgCh_028992 [Apium graveolens]